MTDNQLLEQIRSIKLILQDLKNKPHDLAQSKNYDEALEAITIIGFKHSKVKLLGGFDVVCAIAQKHYKPMDLFEIEKNANSNSKNNTI